MRRHSTSSGGRITDWTVGTGTWSPDVTTDVTLTGAAAPPIAVLSLTTWPSELLGAETEVFHEDDQLTVERIKGQYLFEMADSPAQSALGMVCDVRFRVGESDAVPGGLPTLPNSYDLRDSVWANESFLWHRCHYYTEYASWWTGSSGSFGIREVVDLDIRVKRRLEPYQQLQMVVQWTRRFASPTLRMRISPSFRVLYSQAR